MKAVSAKPVRSRTVGADGGDPVRAAIQHARSAGVALSKVLRTLGRSGKRSEAESESVLCLTASRKKLPVLMLEFSTSSPGRRQTIQLLLTGDQAFLQIPGSKRLAKQLQSLAHQGQQKLRRSESGKR